MMETIEQERHWHLVRNDNGEWISDENAVLLTSVEARSLQIKAKLAGKKLDLQHGYDGTLWCYKHEYLNINNKNLPMKLPSKIKYTNICKDVFPVLCTFTLFTQIFAHSCIKF